MRDAPNSNAELNRATSYDVSLKIATSLTHIEEDKPNRKGWHISYTQRKLTLEIAKSSIFYGMPPNSNAEGNSYSIVMMWSLKLATSHINSMGLIEFKPMFFVYPLAIVEYYV